MRGLAILFATVTIACPALALRDDGAPNETTGQLIEMLGDHRYRVRERATRELERLGVLARPELERAVESTDPEIRRRAGELLERARTEQLFTPALLDYRATKPLGEIIRELAAIHSVDVRLGENLPRDPVKVEYRQMTFWAILRDLSMQHDLGIVWSENRQGKLLAHSNGGRPRTVTSVSGPFIAAIRVDPPPWKLAREPDPAYLQLTLDLSGDGKVDVVRILKGPELLSAETETGEKLVTYHGKENESGKKLHLIRPGSDSRSIKTLKTKLSVLATGERMVFSFPQLAMGARAGAGAAQALVKELRQVDRGWWVVAGEIEGIRSPPTRLRFEAYREDLTYDPEVIQIFDDTGKIRFFTRYRSDSTVAPPASFRIAVDLFQGCKEVELTFHDIPLKP